MALRWKWLLDAKAIHDRLGWLTRAYFVSYAASQVLPTAVGGDAARIYETAKRHPGNTGTIAGSVILERAIGGAATLLLAAIGLALAVGEYDVDVYLWIEAVFVVATIIAGFVIFSKSLRTRLRRFRPLLARLRIERPVRGLYRGMHSYRDSVRVLLAVFVLTIGVQIVRIVVDLALRGSGRRRAVAAGPTSCSARCSSSSCSCRSRSTGSRCARRSSSAS